MAENTNTMITKFSKWIYNDTEDKWYGNCLECRGEKAKHTPQVMKVKGIKPCLLCTNLEAYEAASAHKEKEQVETLELVETEPLAV